MNIGLIIVSVLILLVMFGAGQRVLDKMRMSDTTAIILMVAIAIGLAIPPISIGFFTFSIGGFLIPFGICVYMMVRCGWTWDLVRAVAGTFIVAGVIIGLQFLMPAETPESIVIENVLLYGATAGVIAYIMGRSRRNAFICSVLGLSVSALITFLINLSLGVESTLALGVAGAFDTMIVSTLIAVGLCELIGTTVEGFVGKKNLNYNFEAGTFDELNNKQERRVDTIGELQKTSHARNDITIETIKEHETKEDK